MSSTVKLLYVMKMHLFGGGCGTVQVKLMKKLETTFTNLMPTRKGDCATETSPKGRPPPTGTIARSHCNATQRTATTTYNPRVNYPTLLVSRK